MVEQSPGLGLVWDVDSGEIVVVKMSGSGTMRDVGSGEGLDEKRPGPGPV